MKFSPTITTSIGKVTADCLSVRIRLLNRMVNSIYDAALRPHGVRASQMNILVGVAYFKETTSKQLCEVLHMDSSTFSRTLARLKKNHWLTVGPSGDGKILQIEITKGGIDKIEEVYPAWEKAQLEASRLLGDVATDAIRTVGTRYLQNK